MALHPDREIIAKLGIFAEETGGLERVTELSVDELALVEHTIDNYLDDVTAQMLGGSVRTGRPTLRCVEDAS